MLQFYCYCYLINNPMDILWSDKSSSVDVQSQCQIREVQDLPQITKTMQAAAKLSTMISKPNEQLIKLITQKQMVLWVVVNRNIQKPSFQAVKKLLQDPLSKVNAGRQFIFRFPFTLGYIDLQQISKTFALKVILDENMLGELETINSMQNVRKIFVVGQYKFAVSSKVQKYKKATMYQNYEDILKLIDEEFTKFSFIALKDQNSRNKYSLVFPNFIKLSHKDKSTLKDYRASFFGLVSMDDLDKQASKIKFCDYAKELFNTENDWRQIDNYMNSNMRPQEILHQYTKNSFFYRTVNSTLRLGSTGSDFFAIGEPVNNIFTAIKKCYDEVEREEGIDNKKQFKLYRGAKISRDQATYLKQNTGRFIQILGFISTSKDKQVAQNFDDSANNQRSLMDTRYLIQFHIKRINYKNQSFQHLDYGFVDLEERQLTVRPQEKQVLINALNIFCIKGYQENYNKRGVDKIILQYGTIFQLFSKPEEQLTPIQRQACRDYLRLEQLALRAKDLGNSFLMAKQYDQMEKYYKLRKHQLKVNSIQKCENSLNLANALKHKYKFKDAIQQYQSTLKDLQSLKPANKQQQLELKKTKVAMLTNKSQALLNLNNFAGAKNEVANAQKQILSSLDSSSQDEKLLNSLVMIYDISSSISEQQGNSFQFLNAKKKMTDTCSLLKNNCSDTLKPHQKKQLLEKQMDASQRAIETSLNNINLISTKSSQKNQLENLIKSMINTFNSSKIQLQSFVQGNQYESSIIERRSLQVKTHMLKSSSRSGKASKSQLNQLTVSFEQINNLISSEVGQNDLQLLPGLESLISIKSDQHNLPTQNLFQSIMQKQIKSTNILTSHFGQSHPKTIECQNEIGVTLRKYKKYDQAIEFLEVLKQKSVYDQNQKHTAIALTYFNLGTVYHERGNLKEALKDLEKSLAIYQQIFAGKQNSHTYKVKQQIGAVFLDQFNPAADNILKQSYNFYRKSLNANQQFYARSCTLLGLKSLRYEQIQLSKQYFQTAVKQFTTAVGPKHIQIGKLYLNLSLSEIFLYPTELVAEGRIIQAQNIFKQHFNEDYQIHPLRYKAEWFVGYLSWVKKNFKQAYLHFQLSMKISKEYDHNQRLNQFICRLKMIQCSIGSPLSLQSETLKKKSKAYKLLIELKNDIEKDIQETEKIQINSLMFIAKEDNKKFFILKNIYDILDDPNSSKIKEKIFIRSTQATN